MQADGRVAVCLRVCHAGPSEASEEGACPESQVPFISMQDKMQTRLGRAQGAAEKDYTALKSVDRSLVSSLQWHGIDRWLHQVITQRLLPSGEVHQNVERLGWSGGLQNAVSLILGFCK